jgi:hypothetical protein
MSAPKFRSYLVSLMDHGTFAVWVTAESRHAACELAERMWSESRSAVAGLERGFEYVEILEEYDGDAA